MDVKTAYTKLDLEYGASLDAIEAAFSKLIRVWHPDRFPHAPDLRDDAARKTSELNAARNVLREVWSTGTLNDPSRPPDPFAGELVDEQVVYLGTDPRLPAVKSSWVSSGASAAVWLNSELLTVGLVADGKLVASQTYRVVSIKQVSTDGHFWTERGRELQFDYAAAPADTWLQVEDPAGIVPYIVIQLRFRNEYFRKLFVRSVLQATGFKREDYRPAPPPAPTGDVSSPHGSATDSYVYLGIALFAWLLIIVFVIIVISGSESHPKPARFTDLPSHASSSERIAVWSTPGHRSIRDLSPNRFIHVRMSLQGLDPKQTIPDMRISINSGRFVDTFAISGTAFRPIGNQEFHTVRNFRERSSPPESVTISSPLILASDITLPLRNGSPQ